MPGSGPRLCDKCSFDMGTLSECGYCAAMERKRKSRPQLKLEAGERKDLTHGKHPRIVRKKRPCEPGEVVTLSGKLSLAVTAVKRTKAGEWRVDYLIRDDRPRFVRRVPPMHEPPELDEKGYPIPHDKEAIEMARIDGAVTSAHTLAVVDAGDVVPDEYQTVVTMQGHARHAEFEEAEHAERVADQQAKQLTRKLRKLQVEAAKMAVDITPRLVAMVREAEAELAEKRRAA